MELSVIILARTDSEQSFRMTSECIGSLLVSEPQTKLEIILIESEKNYHSNPFQYPEQVKVIVPDAVFNFHKFLNIGIGASTGAYIALCNNDLIFHDNWFGEIRKVAQANPKILSFSPSGKPCPQAQKGKFVPGYRVMHQIMGWCIVAKRELFDTTGPLDETFDFYYADNDYAMTLKYFNIRHALVCSAYVEHLEGKSVPKKLSATDKSFVRKYQIPEYLKNDHYKWVFESERYLSSILAYHNKWGNPAFLYRKNKIADLLIRNKIGFLNRLFIKIKF